MKTKIAKEDTALDMVHITRELAQVFEVKKSCKLPTQNSKKILEQLPNAISKLLLIGFPLEFMDGDVADIPCNWVKGVLNALRYNIGDKKLLLLSILGVQSSGKSSFLNTMFGLQFATSAGRCILGAYICN